TDLYLSPSVVRIHDTAFDGCRRLHISSIAGTAADRFYRNFAETNVILAEEEDGEEELFYDEPEEWSLPASVSGNVLQEGENAKEQEKREEKDYSSANVDHPSNSVYTEPVDGQGVLGRTKIVSGRAVIFVDNSKVQVYDSDSAPAAAETAVSKQSQPAAAQGEVLKEEETANLTGEIPNTKYVVVGDTIADRAFYMEGTLQSYQIPAGVRRIGDFSFARSGLTSIHIPSGVTEIGYGAFYNCEALTNVIIPSSVTEIEPSAFAGTPWLASWMYGGNLNDFLVVGDGILLAYKGYAENVTIPDGIKVIGPEVFKNHAEIRTVTIPDSVRRIDEDAFNGCTSLENVSGGLSVEEIRDRAFYGCRLQTVRIPESVKSIGLLAYGDMSQTDCVVFMGETFPKLSYEKTATRLSNAEYRRAPFEGIRVFVIPSSAQTSSLEGTVLKEHEMGYQGVICSVLKEPTLQDKGEVSIRRVSHDADGNAAAVPSSVWIYGKEYYVTNVETNAYETAQTQSAANDALPGEADAAAQGGQPADGTDAAGGQDAESVSDNAAAGQTGNLSIRLKRADWKEDAGIYADMTSDPAGYELTISDSESDVLAGQLAGQGIQTDNFNFTAFDLRLVDTASQIPISKLGSQRITVCLPIASAYQNEPVVAVCLDGNGQPEYISCIHRKIGEQSYVLFDVKHFSPYGLLCGDQVPQEYQNAYREKVAAKKAANYDAKLGKKDDSPDTGDRVHPKWFLAAGLTFLALFLFLKKPKRV
ncbi:MAG: leucine-rich repeat domain-containing protein, partial [Lachnospiraceae bacterium]|nr:leucine-rich repeat domain-containing protein [Lachnospiraceae bacterium]